MRHLLIILVFATSLGAANKVPNSSFEAGLRWASWETWSNVFPGDSTGIEISPYQSITNDVPSGGGNTAFVFGTRMDMISEGLWLTNGVQHNVSIYAKAQEANAAVFKWGLVGDQDKGSAPANTASLTTNWTRFNYNFTPSSNGMYFLKLSRSQFSPEGLDPIVDMVMVEEGSTPSTWEAMESVEAGWIQTYDGNVYQPAATKEMTLRFWNTGGATSEDYEVRIYSVPFNELLSTTVGRVSLGATGSTDVQVQLPDRYGTMRIVSRLERPKSADETFVHVKQEAAGTSIDTTGIIGYHSSASEYFADKTRALGFKWTRNLSPSRHLARWTLVEPTDDNFDFEDGTTHQATLASAGLAQVITLATGLDGQWPTAYQAGGDLPTQLSYFTNYAANVVSNYPAGQYVEHLNEPHQFDGTWDVAANYGDLYDESVTAMHGVDATASLIGLGGWSISEYSNASNAWAAVSSGTKASSHAVSGHQYFWNYLTDPNGDADVTSDRNNTYRWLWGMDSLAYSGSTEAWFTEGSVYSAVWHQGMHGLWEEVYNLYQAPTTYEVERSQKRHRHLNETDELIRKWLMLLGYGFEKVWFYEGRNFTSDDFATSDRSDMTKGGSEAKGEHFDGTFKGHVAALAEINTILGSGSGLGAVTNTASSNIEAYLFERGDGDPVIGLWTIDKSLATLTVTNSEFALLDIYGNELQTNSTTLPVSRTPVYMYSTTLATNQFQDMVENASHAAASDTTAPNVSIEIAPLGSHTDGDFTLLTVYTVDDVVVPFNNSVANSTNLVNRYRVDGGSWSSWGPETHWWLTGLSDGHHLYEVESKDPDQNTGAASFNTDITVDSPGSATIGTVNATNLNIGP